MRLLAVYYIVYVSLDGHNASILYIIYIVPQVSSQHSVLESKTFWLCPIKLKKRVPHDSHRVLNTKYDIVLIDRLNYIVRNLI